MIKRSVESEIDMLYFEDAEKFVQYRLELLGADVQMMAER